MEAQAEYIVKERKDLDFSNWRCRASAAHFLMTEGNCITEKQLELLEELKSKPKLTDKQDIELKRLIYKKNHPELSETTKTYLRQVYREAKYNRRKEFSNKFTEKGDWCEEDSLTLYSRVKKQAFYKNEHRFYDQFIEGTPDILANNTVIDIKTSWNLWTFPFQDDSLNKAYFYQVQSYMALTAARSAVVAYCLVNTPESLIENEKRSLFYKMGAKETPEFLEACNKLEREMIFDDIPLKERVIEFEVKLDYMVILKIYEKVEMAREYLNGLSNKN